MKTLCASLFALISAASSLPAFAQAPSYLSEWDLRSYTLSCLPALARIDGPTGVWHCSNLVDTGTALLYNGQPIASLGNFTSAPPPLTVQAGSSYTLQRTDCSTGGTTVAFTNLTSAIAVSLPQPGANFPAGCRVELRNNSWTFQPNQLGTGQTVTLTSTSSTIGGVASFAIYPNRDCWITSDGTNWGAPVCRMFSQGGTTSF